MPDADTPSPTRPDPITRRSEGRWIAGVAYGIAARWEVAPSVVRAGFLVSSAFAGAGVLAYLACWLILPAQSEREQTTERRGIVVIALAGAGLVGLVSLAGFAATATLFGFGWIALALAVLVVVGAFVTWPRASPPWALLPVIALALPSIAVAAAGLRLDPSYADRIVVPDSYAAISETTFRSGLGHLMIDLRRLDAPATGVTRMTIRAGVRRTIVALPTDRCVRVDVRYTARPLLRRLARTATGRDITWTDRQIVFVPTPSLLSIGSTSDVPQRPVPPPPPTPVPIDAVHTGAFGGVHLFGDTSYGTQGIANSVGATRSGARLEIDFESHGGSLYVRDYPHEVDPTNGPNWPGYQSVVEQRPTLASVLSVYDRRTGQVYPVDPGEMTPRVRRLAQAQLRQLRRSWKDRQRTQQRSQKRIERLLPGPCGITR